MDKYEPVNLDELNLTELSELAARNDIPGFNSVGVAKGYPRHVILYALRNLESPGADPAMTTERDTIQRYVKKHWERFRSQAPYKQCPWCLEGWVDKNGVKVRCTDLQVADCYAKNADMLI